MVFKGKKLQKRFVINAVGLALVAFAAPNFAADNYDIVDLGKFEDGSEQVFAFDINQAGNVVGYSIINQETDYSHGFMANQSNGFLTDLGAIDNSQVSVEITNTVNGEQVTEQIAIGSDITSSLVFGISDLDTAVGFSTRIFGSVLSTDDGNGNITESAVATPVERAIYIDTNTLSVSEVPDFVLDSPQNMRALNINGDFIVGTGSFDDPNDVDSNGDAIEGFVARGFVYEMSSDTLTRIDPTLGGEYPNLSLRAINANGYAVGVTAISLSNGFSTVTNSNAIGVNLNDPNQVTTFELFNGSQELLWDINDSGIAVGSTNKEGESGIGAISIDVNNSAVTELGSLNSTLDYSEAFGINSSGQIVGLSQVQSSPSVFHPFLYEDGSMKDLDKLIGCDTGWSLTEAKSINDNGVIVGSGFFNGETHAFMLIPKTGIAPNCDPETEKSGSGSLGYLSFLLLLLIRRRR